MAAAEAVAAVLHSIGPQAKETLLGRKTKRWVVVAEMPSRVSRKPTGTRMLVAKAACNWKAALIQQAMEMIQNNCSLAFEAPVTYYNWNQMRFLQEYEKMEMLPQLLLAADSWVLEAEAY